MACTSPRKDDRTIVLVMALTHRGLSLCDLAPLGPTLPANNKGLKDRWATESGQLNSHRDVIAQAQARDLSLRKPPECFGTGGKGKPVACPQRGNRLVRAGRRGAPVSN